MTDGTSTCPRAWRAGLMCLLFTLAGCSMDSDDDSSGLRNPTDAALTGSVGDGPVLGADITIFDADGDPIVTDTSDDLANYAIVVPPNSRYPLTIVASGGTDLVTGRPLDFSLESRVLDPSESVVNLSPINTFVTRISACMPDGVNATTLEQAGSIMASELSMGLDLTAVPDPLHDPVTAATVTSVVLANEGLGEVLRRAQIALEPTSSQTDFDTLIDRIACDLTDGIIDGTGGSTIAGAEPDSRTAGTLFAVMADVALEILAGRLEVDGQSAVFLMDDAIRRIFPDDTISTSVTDVPVTDAFVSQTRDAVAVLHSSLDDEALTKILVLLDETPTAEISTQVAVELSNEDESVFDGLADRVAVADETTLDTQMASSRDKENALPPLLSFDALPTALESGEQSTLSWASANADKCLAEGAWTGQQPIEGTFATGPLQSSAEYRLACSGLGGSATQTLLVSVADAPPPANPQVNLVSNASTVFIGENATLSWSASDVDACNASGSWSGPRNLSDSASVGPLSSNSTFTLTCDGPGGSVSDSVAINVQEPPPPAPILSLSANPISILAGANSQLTWSSNDATSCTASGAWSGSRSVDGSASVGPLTSTSTFGLNCSGPGGDVSRTVTVSVTTPPAPTLALAANPTTLGPSETASVSWSSTNATSCLASGGWSGSRSTSGSSSVGPITAATTYTLTCSGAGGSVTRSSVVSYQAPTPTLSLSAAPTSVTEGQNTVLNWSASSVTSCTANGGWSGSKAASGSETISGLSSTTSFGLVCTGAGGSINRSVTVTVTATPAPAVSLSATPTSVGDGETSQLSWSSTNATSCSAAGGWSGSKTTSGNQSVGPITATTDYMLTCTGTGGSVTRTATVTFAPTAPTLTLTASASTVNDGDNVTLNWSTTNADTCDAAGDWSGSRPTAGSADVGPIATDSTFTLNCSGAGGSVSQTRNVTVAPTAPPSVDLSASPDWVSHGAATTLSWTASNADSCDASGAWSGSKNTSSGSESTGPVTEDSTYSITCSGAGGSAVSAVSVGVRAALLSWEAPTHNVDGTLLTDLVGFNVYYGQGSRNYSNVIPINDAATLELLIDLNPGTYFFTVTARNAADEESAFSGEVSKTIE